MLKELTVFITNLLLLFALIKYIDIVNTVRKMIEHNNKIGIFENFLALIISSIIVIEKHDGKMYCLYLLHDLQYEIIIDIAHADNIQIDGAIIHKQYL